MGPLLKCLKHKKTTQTTTVKKAQTNPRMIEKGVDVAANKATGDQETTRDETPGTRDQHVSSREGE